MMDVKRQNLETTHEVELIIDIAWNDVLLFVEKTAIRISETQHFEGFRPGHVPFDMVRKKIGDERLLEASLDTILAKTVFDAIKSEKLQTIGAPRINIKKAAFGQSLQYSAVVALIPTVVLPDFEQISISLPVIEVSPQEVDTLVEEIRVIRASEVLVQRKAENGDKVIVDFTISREGVILEDGAQRDYPVLLGAKQILPEFEDNILELRAGEEKEFLVVFPDNYYNKSVAGKNALVSLRLKAVYQIEKPAISEEFIKSLHSEFNSVEDFRKRLQDNIRAEKERDSARDAESRMIDVLIEKCNFSPIPPALLEQEARTMLRELEDTVVGQGAVWEDYLAHIKKTDDELKGELMPEAEKRVKAGVILREVSFQQEIEVSSDEIDADINATLKRYPGVERVANQVKQKAYRDYIKTLLQNRKAIAFLKEWIIK